MKIVISERFSDIEFIHDSLYAYNCTKSGSEHCDGICASVFPEQFAICLLDDNDNLCGGAAYHWLNEPRHVFVDYFFLEECVRNGGWGRKIFDVLTDTVKNAGAELIELTTNTFQAPWFYEKLGFEVVKTEKSPTVNDPDNLHFLFRKKILTE